MVFRLSRFLHFILITSTSIILIPDTGLSQTDEILDDLAPVEIKGEDGWKKGGVGNINFAQTSLTNWAGGGQNSINFNGMLHLFASYKKNKSAFDNTLDISYGTINRGTEGFIKSDDRIDLFSKYGKMAKGKWYYAGLLNFRTQMLKGYKNPTDSVYISNWLSPAYILEAIGMDYRPGENFTCFVAPFTGKITIVSDSLLSSAGAFGVDSGKVTRKEIGGYLKIFVRKQLVENVVLQSKLDIFSNYLNNPQNLDINWEVLLALKVNKFLAVNISTHLIYDDDVDIAVDVNNDGITDATGPRTQYKQVMAVGLNFKF